MKIRNIFFILAFFFLASVANAKTNDVLSVSGNKILLNGSEITLRGVAVGDPHARQLVSKRTTKDYATIKNDWQANVVRLSVHPGVFANDWTHGKGILEKEVAAARAQGLFVIIDWHVIGVPDGYFKPTTSDYKYYYNYDSDFDLAKNFWTYAAKKFSSDRGVVFEVWNEPVDLNSDFGWDYLRPKMQELTDLIRNLNANNMILVPGVYWTYDMRGIKNNPISGENIAYAWHNYNGSQNYADWTTALDGLNEKYPVMITEWGSESDKDLGYDVKNGLNQYHYLEAIKNLIIEKNLHYTAWCWHATWKPRMLNSDWKTLNNYGKLVKDFLANPEKITLRLIDDEIKKEKADAEARAKEEARLAAIAAKEAEKSAKLKKEAELAKQKVRQTEEFKLRVQGYLADGADFNSHKLGIGERKAVLTSYINAFGHEPGNENEWQDLLLISNGHWPSRSSSTAEQAAKETFFQLFKRYPNMSVNNDKHAVKILTYGLRQRPEKKNIKKEKESIMKFKKIFKHDPKSLVEWNMVQAIAYGGVK